MENADVAKLADAIALGAIGETLGGSNPSVRTKYIVLAISHLLYAIS